VRRTEGNKISEIGKEEKNWVLKRRNQVVRQRNIMSEEGRLKGGRRARGWKRRPRREKEQKINEDGDCGDTSRRTFSK